MHPGSVILFWTLGVYLLLLSLEAKASSADYTMPELLDMDLSELMEIPVSLNGRQEQARFQTPAAVSIIHGVDIRRSGLRTIPELLRLVPGFHVGKIDANKWTISSRSVGSQFSGTMLVMLDGRTLYNPLFAGTYWEVQDTLLEDIDHIEVIRGPGGSLWGANAVTGIVNIVTKNARQTQGEQLILGAGSGDIRSEASYRHGVQVTEDSYARVYAKTRHQDNGEYIDGRYSTNDGYFNPGDEAYDQGRFSQAGFRWDMQRLADHFNVQGDYYQGYLQDIRYSSMAVAANDIHVYGANLSTSWQRRLSDHADFQLNAYFDISDRKDDSFEYHQHTLDLDFQHNFVWLEQQISWGLGTRQISDDTAMPISSSPIAPRLNLNPAVQTTNLYQFFIQDSVSLIPDTLKLYLGSRFEHNDFTGYEYQPSIRLGWTPDPHQTLWLAETRSVRIPSRGDLGLYLDYNDTSPCPFSNDPTLGCVLLVNNPDAEADVVVTTELGYRVQINRQHSVDIALFYDDYQHDEVVDPNIINIKDNTRGIEINTWHQLTKSWHLELWYVQHQQFLKTPGGAKVENSLIPLNSAHLRSYWSINQEWEWDVLVYFVDDTFSSSGTTVSPDYTRIDTRLGWKLNNNLSTDLVLRNLLDDVHVESYESTRINTGVPRSFEVKLDYRF